MGLPRGNRARRVQSIILIALVGGDGIWIGGYIFSFTPDHLPTARYYIPLSGKDRLAAMQSAYRIHETWRDAFGVEVEVRLEGA